MRRRCESMPVSCEIRRCTSCSLDISREKIATCFLFLKAAFFAAEAQVLKGTVGGAAAGFSGLADALLFGGAMVVNAGGTTAATGSSVYAVRSTPDLNNVSVIMGANGMIDVGETVVQRLAGATGTYPAYYTPISAWMGLQIGSSYSAGRICNITEDSGKKLTDALLAQLIEKFPAGRGPNYLVMNRRSLRQLQASRTATNPTGAPAPFPSEAFGIPIVVTDAISSTEALLS